MKFFLSALLILLSTSVHAARFEATGPIAFYVDNTGSDANDGLTPATPKKSYCKTLRSAYQDWDFRGFQGYMFVRASQTFNEMCGTGGTIIGGNSVIIAPYDPANPSTAGNIIPAANYVRTCTPPVCGSMTPKAQWCDALGDYPIQIYYNATYYNCNYYNMIGGGGIVMHNHVTVDFFGTRSTFSGSGANDTAVLMDGPSILTVQNAPLINGQFGYVFQCNRDCNATVSGPFELNYANIRGYYALYGGSHFNLGIGSYPVNMSTYGASVISGFSTLNDNGTAIPGGVTNVNAALCHVALGC